MQKKGMVVAYMSCPSFKKFVRIMVGLPFVPINEVQEAFSAVLVEYKFKENNTDLEKFKSILLDYFESTWLNGSFPKSLWNYWRKPYGLTNNRQTLRSF